MFEQFLKSSFNKLYWIVWLAFFTSFFLPTARHQQLFFGELETVTGAFHTLAVLGIGFAGIFPIYDSSITIFEGFELFILFFPNLLFLFSPLIRYRRGPFKNRIFATGFIGFSIMTLWISPLQSFEITFLKDGHLLPGYILWALSVMFMSFLLLWLFWYQKSS